MHHIPILLGRNSESKALAAQAEKTAYQTLTADPIQQALFNYLKNSKTKLPQVTTPVLLILLKIRWIPRILGRRL